MRVNEARIYGHLLMPRCITYDVPRIRDILRPSDIPVGSTLRVLSSNRCKGGVHRVISSEEGRSSIVFALRPCLRYGIELEKFGGFGSVHSRQLYGTITARKTNVNARKTSVISQGSGTG